MYYKVKTEILYFHKYSDPLLRDSKLSSGASSFHWSSLRCFYNLESTCGILYLLDMIWNGTFVDLRDRIVSRQRSGEGYQDIYAALKVPKNTVASIILKCKKFGTTKTLPRAGFPAKLSNRERKVFAREVIKNLMVTLTELQSSSMEMGEPSRRTTISAALHQSGLYGSVARRKPLLSKRHNSPLRVCQKAPKVLTTMRNKIPWSD